MGEADRTLDERRNEFLTHIWDHTDDPFQAFFDERRPLTGSELDSLVKLVKASQTITDADSLAEVLRAELSKSSDELLGIILQMVGSTRSKILGDIKAKKIKAPSDYRKLPTKAAAWKIAGRYLATRMICVFGGLGGATVEGALEALNQATYPGYIRQQRAKLQGHEAEKRLANLLLVCGLPFAPEEKASNPLCRDVQLAGVSFDLVVPSVSVAQVCFKCTVHTSNIGQFGESKDALEAVEAKENLASLFPENPPTLMVLIDGVGFNSNTAGLTGVLNAADEFCQFATLWKAAVVAAAACGQRISLSLSSADKDRHAIFLRRYAGSVLLVDPSAEGRWVDAGDGKILIP
jgi:hypothetical protein